MAKCGAAFLLMGIPCATAFGADWKPGFSQQATNAASTPYFGTISQIDQYVKLTEAQKGKVNPLISGHLDEIAAAHHDSTLSHAEKRAKFESARRAIVTDVRPFLTRSQWPLLDSMVNWLRPDTTLRKKRSFVPLISVSYEKYFLSDSLARSIFGSQPSSFSFSLLGLDVDSTTLKGYRISLGLDTLSIDQSGNKLFVFSPQMSVEYRQPIARNFSSYAKVAAGPSYLDYSFDVPSGNHFGAKRFGADGDFEVGLRVGRAQLSAEYRFLTEPAGINFDGLELGLTYVVVKF